MNTKVFIFLSTLLVLFLSCSKQDNESFDLPVTSEEEVKSSEEFAKIFSKAIFRNTALRSFIKTKANLQFDNDYDVFYPFVKDDVVENGMSFRDILVKNSNEKTISLIEKDLPLLNILVPNLSFSCDFNAQVWDTRDSVVSVAVLENGDTPVYLNGNKQITLKEDEIPCFPILVIKNNERLQVNKIATKGNDLSYSFINDAFDKSKNLETKGRHVTTTIINYPTEGASKWVPKDLLDPLVINAWNIIGDNDTICQRDNIYSKMTSSHDPEKVNNNVFETLLRFKLNDISSADQYTGSTNKDGNDPEFITEIKQKKHGMSDEDLYKRIWTDGKFEIMFSFIIGDVNRNFTKAIELTYSVDPYDLFDLSKIQCDFKHHTATQHALYTYKMNPKDLVPKWFYPEAHSLENKLFNWNLNKKSYTINWSTIEKDLGQTLVKTVSLSQEFSINAAYNVSNENSQGSIGSSIKTSQTFSSTLNTTSGSDDLGANVYEYTYPIIISKEQKSSKDGYNLFSIGSGHVDITITPKDIFN